MVEQLAESRRQIRETAVQQSDDLTRSMVVRFNRALSLVRMAFKSQRQQEPAYVVRVVLRDRAQAKAAERPSQTATECRALREERYCRDFGYGVIAVSLQGRAAEWSMRKARRLSWAQWAVQTAAWVKRRAVISQSKLGVRNKLKALFQHRFPVVETGVRVWKARVVRNSVATVEWRTKLDYSTGIGRAVWYYEDTSPIRNRVVRVLQCVHAMVKWSQVIERVQGDETNRRNELMGLD